MASPVYRLCFLSDCSSGEVDKAISLDEKGMIQISRLKAIVTSFHLVAEYWTPVIRPSVQFNVVVKGVEFNPF